MKIDQRVCGKISALLLFRVAVVSRAFGAWSRWQAKWILCPIWLECRLTHLDPTQQLMYPCTSTACVSPVLQVCHSVCEPEQQTSFISAFPGSVCVVAACMDGGPLSVAWIYWTGRNMVLRRGLRASFSKVTDPTLLGLPELPSLHFWRSHSAEL